MCSDFVEAKTVDLRLAVFSRLRSLMPCRSKALRWKTAQSGGKGAEGFLKRRPAAFLSD